MACHSWGGALIEDGQWGFIGVALQGMDLPAYREALRRFYPVRQTTPLNPILSSTPAHT